MLAGLVYDPLMDEQTAYLHGLMRDYGEHWEITVISGVWRAASRPGLLRPVFVESGCAASLRALLSRMRRQQ